MSEPKPAETPKQQEQKGFAWGAAIWATIGAALAFRTFYHPHRAVVERGFASRCTGDTGCNSPMTIQPERGTTTAYAVTSGTVVLSSAGLMLVSDREPVLIGYGAQIGQVLLPNGAEVGIGTPLAVMRQVDLTVTEIVRSPTGQVSFRALEPASWLASRGLTIAAKGNLKGALWCTHGRTIVLPTKVAQCGTKLPAPSAALLLPVSVTME